MSSSRQFSSASVSGSGLVASSQRGDAGGLGETDVQFLVARRARLPALGLLREVLKPHALQLAVLRRAGEHRSDGLGERLGEQQVELLDEAVELRPRQSPFLYQFEYLVVLAVLPLLQLLHLCEESRGIERHVEPPRIESVMSR